MMMPGRSYTAKTGYRYGFNGKENDNEVKNIEGSQQDYGMRMYDPRLGKFLSVDPLTKSYPWYTPYQFAGNMPLKFIDLDGLEPALPGDKVGDYQVAKKEGTENSFGWTWSKDKNRRRNFGYWKQGSSTEYQNGNVATTSSNDDDNKKYFPAVKVKPLTLNDVWSPLSPFNNNSEENRLSEFSDCFTAGTKLEDDAAEGEAQQLLNNFISGSGRPLTFNPNSRMANILSQDPAFKNLAKSFEQQALSYYQANKTLEGFPGNNTLISLRMPYIKDTWFMHTVLGGTQQWNAQIRSISATEIKVQYTVHDHFGAGTDDARSSLPGLPSLYWLQHNSAHFSPASSSKYNPFNWNIQVNR